MFLTSLVTRRAGSLCCLLCSGIIAAQTPDSTKVKVPVAIVGGQTIYEEDLRLSVEPQLIKLHNEEYEAKKKALNALIEQKLLELAAQKRGITTDELLRQDVDAKVSDPSESELQAYYLGQRDRLNRPFVEVKEQLRQSFKQAKVQEARQEYVKGLRKAGEVTVLLVPPKVSVGFDARRVRGNPNAKVMIVEFSDFQCPYCRQVEATLANLLSSYGDRVCLAYRDFPLPQLHPQAEQAAEASRCAGEQGRFWEYHDQLIRSSKLEQGALLEYAHMLKLDDKQFESCVATGKYRADIQRDVQEGTQVGVTGTPGFFINGIPLSGAQSAEAFTRIIEEELARPQP